MSITQPRSTDAADDERLMQMVRRGDAEAFGALYQRYYKLAVAIARRYVNDVVAAEDIAQESFLSLWKYRDRYRWDQGSPRTWLTAITHNRAIDATRRAKARPQQSDSLELVSQVASSDDVAHETERRERSRRMRDAIASLPRPQREVMSLSAYGELTHVEIARHTGAPLGTVKGRSRLAMAKLRADLAA